MMRRIIPALALLATPVGAGPQFPKPTVEKGAYQCPVDSCAFVPANWVSKKGNRLSQGYNKVTGFALEAGWLFKSGAHVVGPLGAPPQKCSMYYRPHFIVSGKGEIAWLPDVMEIVVPSRPLGAKGDGSLQLYSDHAGALFNGPAAALSKLLGSGSFSLTVYIERMGNSKTNTGQPCEWESLVVSPKLSGKFDIFYDHVTTISMPVPGAGGPLPKS